MHQAKNVLFYDRGVTHKEGPFLNVLWIFQEKTHKEYGNGYVYVFAESKYMMTPTQNGSTRFRYFSTNDAKKNLKVFAARSFNKNTLPSQIVLCEFLLIHQRLMFFKPDCA